MDQLELMDRLVGETKQSGATVAQKGFDQSVDRVGSTAGSEWDRLITISCYYCYININVWKAKEASR